MEVGDICHECHSQNALYDERLGEIACTTCGLVLEARCVFPFQTEEDGWPIEEQALPFQTEEDGWPIEEQVTRFTNEELICRTAEANGNAPAQEPQPSVKESHNSSKAYAKIYGPELFLEEYNSKMAANTNINHKAVEGQLTGQLKGLEPEGQICQKANANGNTPAPEPQPLKEEDNSISSDNNINGNAVDAQLAAKMPRT